MASRSQHRAAILNYYYYSGGGASPETDVPVGEPSLQITGTKIVSSGSGSTDWHGRTAVEVRDGIVILVYRVASAHNVNDGSLHIRFSDDYGATWTAANTYLDGSAVTGFPWRPASFIASEDPGEPWLILAPNGDLLVFGWEIDYGVASGGTWYSRSSDGGKTWTTPAQIAVIGVPGDFNQNSNFMTNDHFVLDGVIYLSSWNHDGTQISVFLKSEDNGTTWEFVSKITDGDIDSDVDNYEAGLCYVGNDTIISIMRNGSNSAALYKTSTDMGATWGALSDISSWGVTARHRMFQRSRLKGKPNWWLDPVIIASVFTHGNPGNSHPRINGVQISKDFGVTFPYVLNLDPTSHKDDGGYNDLFYNPLTDEYVSAAYRGAAITKASVVQYNFKINWAEASYNFANTHELVIDAAGEELEVINNDCYPSDGADTDKPFSCEIWMETRASYSLDGRLIAGVGSNDTGAFLWAIHYDASDELAWFRLVDVGSSAELRKRAATNSLPLGALTHIIATYDGSKTFAGMRIFINGTETTYQPDASVGTYAGMAALDGDLKIRVAPISTEAVGNFQVVRYFNHELSTHDVTKLYNSGTPVGLDFNLKSKCVQELLMNNNANADNIGNNGSLVGGATFQAV